MAQAVLWAVFFAVALLVTSCVCVEHGGLSPILIIPGNSGSQLNAEDSSNTNCNTNGEARNVWLNLTHIVASSQCFISQLRLEVVNGYSDAPDVTVTTASFGSTSSVEFLDSDATLPYMNDFVEYFVQRGYTRDVNIRAAPYDWRLAGEQLEARGYYTALRLLVEQMYIENNNTKVTVVVHSMGGPVSLYFLTEIVSQEWKDIYIHSYVALAAAYGGASVALPGIISGPVYTASNTTNNPMFELFTLIFMQGGASELRALYRSYPSGYWLAPRVPLWDDAVTIIATPNRNYTINDYEQLFTDVGYLLGYTQFMSNPLDLSAPNVSTYCFYGLGYPTPLTFVYGNGFSETPTSIINGDGDNTVNKVSLEACQMWADSGYPFSRTVFENIDHFNVTSADVVLSAIGRIVGAPAEPINVCDLPADPGPCRARIPRYFFNSKRGVCEEFTYGGCGGNSNNYESLEECNGQCNPNGCPPLCTNEYCTAFDTRRSLCTLRDPLGECDAKCRVTYCHTCYYGDEHRPLPGDCDTCSYYPTLRQTVNKCFKRWAVCTRRANGNQYSKARGRKEKTAERFKCYEHPCV